MRRTSRAILLPAAVALMTSLGMVMSAAAQEAPDTAAGLESVPAAQNWKVLDQLVAIGVLPVEARDALVRVRLEHSAQAAPGAVCRRVANAGSAPASLVERCRTWLGSQDDGADAGRLAVCRRIANGESVDATLVERCRAILTELPQQDVRPERPERPERAE